MMAPFHLAHAEEDATAEEEGSPEKTDSGPFMNLQVSPIPLILGWFDIDLVFRVNEDWMMGPTASYWNIEVAGLHFKVMSLGIRGEYALRGPWKEDGLFLAPNLTYTDISYRLHSSSDSASKFVSGAAVLGYRFHGGSGFNASAGLGVGLTSIGKDTKFEVDGRSEKPPFYSLGVYPVFELAVGWSF